MKSIRRLAFVLTLSALLSGPALAGPRSGASFGSRGGFRSGAGSLSRGYQTGRSGYGGGGSGFFFLPSFGWGLGGYGTGGGLGLMGSLVLLGVVGLGAVAVMRAVRRAVRRGTPDAWSDDEVDEGSGESYVCKVQLGLGRSARRLQGRLADFASQGDTSSEAGLAELLHQTALELLREKDSIRYALAEASGPMSMTNGETRLNATAMAERARFEVERIRVADGSVRRSQAAASVGAEPLEYLVVTVIVATRVPLASIHAVSDRESLEAALGELGAIPSHSLLGLEVVWTPADAEDSLTETDLMTTYPELRSL
jgi:uncharacterized membrane protein